MTLFLTARAEIDCQYGHSNRQPYEMANETNPRTDLLISRTTARYFVSIEVMAAMVAVLDNGWQSQWPVARAGDGRVTG